MKATSCVFALIAFLPIIKFPDVTEHKQSVLKAWLFHFCLNIILKPLKAAEQDSVLMFDTSGLLHMVHTPLVVWITDYPEQ